MSKKMKNIAQSEVLTLREQISYQEGQVVSKTLTQNQAVSITLFSFAKGEEISTHESGGDAFVTCLDGIGKITIDGVEYLLHEGESIVMDGKLDLSIRGKIPEQMDADADKVFGRIEKNGGMLPFTDKADPERIKSEMGMSKAAFKRAVGRLLKQGKIQIDNEVGKIFAVNKNR